MCLWWWNVFYVLYNWNIRHPLTVYNPFLVYCRELAPGTVSLTGDRAQGDDSKHDSHYTSISTLPTFQCSICTSPLQSMVDYTGHFMTYVILSFCRFFSSYECKIEKWPTGGGVNFRLYQNMSNFMINYESVSARPQYRLNQQPDPSTLYSYKVSKVAKTRNRYNQVPHLTQDTNGKVTNSQKTPQTRAKRSALSQQVTTKHI